MRSAGATDDQLREMGFTTEQLNAPPVGFDDGTGSPASFYGMDTYSVNASAKAVIEFLEIVDPEAASVARARYATLEGFGDEMKKYGMAVVMGELKDKSLEIQEQIASVLVDLQRQNRESYDLILGPAELLNAEQNAQVVVNGEAYFREMCRSMPAAAPTRGICAISTWCRRVYGSLNSIGCSMTAGRQKWCYGRTTRMWATRQRQTGRRVRSGTWGR